MRPSQIYDGFIRFEEQSAEIYLDLSIRFVGDTDLSWFWVEMAMEEKQHAGLLQYCRETGICAETLPTRDQILNLRSLFENLQARVSDPSLGIDGAFEIAITLESSEINQIYTTLTEPIQRPIHILRKKIDLSVENHFQRLAEAARRFGASPGVQERLCELSSKASKHGSGS
jgi:hypothetical protein